MIDLKLTSQPLLLADLMSKVSDPTCGGICSFVGTVRNNTDGREVLRLEFESYESMALKELKKIANKASKKWNIRHLLIHHRVGKVEVGELAVIIIAVGTHRDATFSACKYAIDTLKDTVPIWKKEIFTDGSEWVTPHP